MFDSVVRYAFLAFDTGMQWAREELHSRGVRVPITEAFLKELVSGADAAARLRDPDTTEPYGARFRREIATRAEFVRAWTQTDDRVNFGKERTAQLVSLARKHALPRAWQLSEPVASVAREAPRTYLYWASSNAN
jgi:hypothetical protein